MNKPKLVCFKLLRHVAFKAVALAFANAGSNNEAKIAIIAITTSNSIRVKPFFQIPCFVFIF